MNGYCPVSIRVCNSLFIQQGIGNENNFNNKLYNIIHAYMDIIFFQVLVVDLGFCLLACLLYLSHSSYWIIPLNPHVTNVTSLNCMFLYLSSFSYCSTQIYKHLYKGGHNGLFYKNRIILQVWYVMRKYEVKWSKVKSLSSVRLLATPWTVVYQASPPMRFSRQEYWSGLLFPSPGDLPDPGKNEKV